MELLFFRPIRENLIGFFVTQEGERKRNYEKIHTGTRSICSEWQGSNRQMPYR